MCADKAESLVVQAESTDLFLHQENVWKREEKADETVSLRARTAAALRYHDNLPCTLCF